MNTNKINILNDLGTLLKIPNKVLEELVLKTNLCIGSIIQEAMLTNEQTVQINIGIGTLSISLADMQCKFIPSKELKSTIKKCLQERIDPLELALEEILAEKLKTICEEVL